jgi:hypothetical protein
MGTALLLFSRKEPLPMGHAVLGCIGLGSVLARAFTMHLHSERLIPLQ